MNEAVMQFLKSKRVMGALAGVLLHFAAKYGLEVSDDQAMEVIDQALLLVSFVWVTYTKHHDLKKEGK